MPPSLNSVRKTVTSFGKNANAYAQAEAPGTIDQSVDVLRNKYHQPVPGADLLMTDVYDQLMPEVQMASLRISVER
jgi:hypothetical protein